jgi:hypothetical protein
MRGCRLANGRWIVLGLVPIVCLVALSTTSAPPNRRSPFVPTVVLPQQAVGDFDGDGRADVARIQHDVHGSSITVHLSDSTVTTQLDANVTALVQRDIDHDGDLDLIATTPTGAILIWINDGHGEFSPQEPSPAFRLAGNSELVHTAQSPSAAVTVPIVPLAPAHTRNLMVVTRIRPPTVESICSRTFGLFPPFRGPPSVHS